MVETKILDIFPADSSRQLQVPGHDGDSPGMERTQVGVLEQTDEVGLDCLLKMTDVIEFNGLSLGSRSYLESQDSGSLEPDAKSVVLGDLPHQTLEGQLPDQELGALLVSPNLSQGDSSRLESVRLLDHFLHLTTSGGHPGGGLGGDNLVGCLLLGKLLHPWSHSSCGLARSLLCSDHVLRYWSETVIYT